MHLADQARNTCFQVHQIRPPVLQAHGPTGRWTWSINLPTNDGISSPSAHKARNQDNFQVCNRTDPPSPSADQERVFGPSPGHLSVVLDDLRSSSPAHLTDWATNPENSLPVHLIYTSASPYSLKMLSSLLILPPPLPLLTPDLPHLWTSLPLLIPVPETSSAGRETPTWKTSSVNLCPPLTGWPSYTPRHWVFICSPFTNHMNSWWDNSYPVTTRVYKFIQIFHYRYLIKEVNLVIWYYLIKVLLNEYLL